MEDFENDFDVKNIKQEEFSFQSELLAELLKPTISLRRSREPRKIVERIEQPATESAEARRRRLKVKRLRVAAKKLKESPEARERRLQSDRDRKKRINEIPETRERRLQKDRERKAKQRAQNSTSNSSSKSWATQSKNKNVQSKHVYSDRDSNSCRFCLKARGEKKIPAEFFKVFENYCEIEVSKLNDFRSYSQ